MLQSKTHSDLLGRLTGIVILLAGVGLLGMVFTYANHLFHSPIAGLSSIDRSQPPTAQAVGGAVGQFLGQIVLLGLMTAIASVIAGKGVDMYFAANHTPPRTERHDAPAAETKHG
ncbi:MAG: hypothetical protein ACLQVD_02965 [Capsulimonadaceae bacterium]